MFVALVGGSGATRTGGVDTAESAGVRPEEVMARGRQGDEPLMPRRVRVPDFALTESLGEPLTHEHLRGKVWVASFLFTSCGAVCPAMARRLQSLQSSLPEGAVIVSITVDPARDTPEVLRTYAEAFERQPGKWLLLTGEWDEIDRVASEGFSLGGDKPLFHSVNLALVDQEGYIRGYYDSRSEEKLAEMLRDVLLLLGTPTD